ncbi:MAG: hypothetical protein ACXWWN_07860 [Gemmatimonadales bacterium]
MRLAALWVLALVWACSDGPTADHPIPAEIRLLSPATQSGTPGWPLPDSIIVEVLDAEGQALSGVPVTWSASNGDDRLGRPADTTNIAGRAAAEWTLGWNEGAQSLAVTAGELAPVTVTATATIFHAASVTVGDGFACALTESGRAFCWGWNYQGQVGNGTVANPVLAPTPVAGDLVFTALTASSTHACGLVTGGVAYCWGANESGETGTGTFGLSVPAPTPVQTELRFTQISAEGNNNWSNSTCGLTAVGEAWCWGYNGLAKLGDGTTNNSAVPVRVVSDVPFGSIHTGFFHSCATAAAGGELWCWGQQESDIGPFGVRLAGLYPSPQQVHPDFRFGQLSTGRNSACGLTAQGAALCWGTNWFASLGPIFTDQSWAVPRPVADGITFVKLSPTWFEEMHGLSTDGIIYHWDDRVPTPTTQFRFTQMDSGWDPFGGSAGSCGIAASGALYCVSRYVGLRGVFQAGEP